MSMIRELSRKESRQMAAKYQDTLQPCPFCGGRPKLDNLGDDHDFYVRCLDCEVQQIANYTPEVAAERWNRRPR